MLGWSISPGQVMRGIDQRDMRERLREIAHLPAGSRIVFLRQQSEIVAQIEEPLEQRPRVHIAALQDIIVGEPEAASKERSYIPRQAVNSALGVVARDKAVSQQELFYGSHRAHDAGIVGG